ncbi:MAG: hypothetical protein ABFD10_13990 [Prolixibacteraceae bacterium]
MVRITSAERIIPVLPKRYSGILKVATFLLFFAGIIAAAGIGCYGGALIYKHATGVQLNSGHDNPL